MEGHRGSSDLRSYRSYTAKTPSLTSSFAKGDNQHRSGMVDPRYDVTHETSSPFPPEEITPIPAIEAKYQMFVVQRNDERVVLLSNCR